ncbi:aminopeptidase [Zea mays]|uniref:Aminopeptidase n=1 Tax=Zea mays TaxID=4577 RepID=A0A1D6F5Z4_MAIZE|nr:aminopeptidase [Zea mays]ONM26693.1 aminopeptidase [Zea mays]ONM26695.1 aminopeptidase [Zea mays]ONM26696.1 aminopeptidase [Zea mays]
MEVIASSHKFCPSSAIEQKGKTEQKTPLRQYFTIRIDRLFSKKQVLPRKDTKKTDGINDDVEEPDLYVERVRLEKMELSVMNLLRKMTIQEPTFERMIVVYSLLANTVAYSDPNVIGRLAQKPEKKNPSLTPMDWVTFLISAVIGLVTLIGSLEMPKADIWFVTAILSGLVGYCAKIYFTFQANMVQYQNLITKSMYDKQLDSGRGTLLHLCDDVIQQEVKEVIISYYILMEQGKATVQDLDSRCEQLIKEEFGMECNFDVVDADSIGRILCVPLKRANEIIGTTTEEMVMRAQQASG